MLMFRHPVHKCIGTEYHMVDCIVQRAKSTRCISQLAAEVEEVCSFSASELRVSPDIADCQHYLYKSCTCFFIWTGLTSIDLCCSNESTNDSGHAFTLFFLSGQTVASLWSILAS